MIRQRPANVSNCGPDSSVYFANESCPPKNLGPGFGCALACGILLTGTPIVYSRQASEPIVPPMNALKTWLFGLLFALLAALSADAPTTCSYSPAGWELPL